METVSGKKSRVTFPFPSSPFFFPLFLLSMTPADMHGNKKREIKIWH